MYKILLHKKAAKIYERLDEKSAAILNEGIESLKNNPFYGRNIKRLKGDLEGKFRLRIGKYRVVYRVEKAEKIIIIEDIGRRGKVY